jgi:peptide/nickel transport system substrate-binding protein
MTKPNLQDVRVRKALAHVVNYEHFIKNIRKNLATRAMAPILPTKKYYAKDMVPYDFNIEKARSFLKEAGWADSNNDGYVDKDINGQNVKLRIEVLTPPIRLNQQYAESIMETARLAGIEVVIVTTDISIIGAKTKSGDYETALLGAILSPGLSELSQRYHSKYLAPLGDNKSRYANPTLDALLDKIRSEEDEAKRNVMYLEAQRIIYDDLPEIFILAPKQPVITAKKFKAVVSPMKPGYFEQFFKLN